MELLKNSQDQIKACVWTDVSQIEQSALDQIHNIMGHPSLFKHVAIMPDVHAGVGATIGSVIPLKNAIIPSAVGVDIGCGMCAVKTNIHRDQITEHFDEIYSQIIKHIPLGFSHRSDIQVQNIMKFIPENFLQKISTYENDDRWNQNKIINQLGTLGGGNHFIELQIDKYDHVWIMLHSGSRNIGNKIATTYIKLAKEICTDAPAPDLEYFAADSSAGEDYIIHSTFATEFALLNRRIMLEVIKQILREIFPDIAYMTPINIHHNYVNFEEHFGEMIWVHRKGATRVSPNITGIIPGSMGSSSYIVSGTGNTESFNSCSHGAGRSMSRTAARGKFNRRKKEYTSEGKLSIEDFKQDMNGIYTKSLDRDHLDEAPRAYKQIDEVMNNQTDLVEIKVKLTPIFNIKG